MNKKETKAKFDKIVDRHLNGELKLFLASCDELRCELDDLTPKEIKELSNKLRTKLNEA